MTNKASQPTPPTARTRDSTDDFRRCRLKKVEKKEWKNCKTLSAALYSNAKSPVGERDSKVLIEFCLNFNYPLCRWESSPEFIVLWLWKQVMDVRWKVTETHFFLSSSGTHFIQQHQNRTRGRKTENRWRTARRKKMFAVKIFVLAQATMPPPSPS